MAVPSWQPMLPTAGRLPTDPERFGFEVKWDGVRALLAVERGKLRITTRNGRDASAVYPELAGIAGPLGGRAVLLDAELVTFDESGRPSFGRHQRRMHVRSPSPALVTEVPVIACLFDVVWLDGESLCDIELRDRRVILESLELTGPTWRTPPWSIGDATGITTLVEQRGLEGLVAKRLDSPYRPGVRTTNWIKVKSVSRSEFVVGGWTDGERGRAGRIGSLAIGAHVDGRLRYCGRVGSGLSGMEMDRLGALLAPLATEDSPFDGPVPDRPHFVEPRLVVEVSFTEWTADGHLRHPVYLGQRLDKDPIDVQLSSERS